jgi:hypothetical protein
MQQNNHNLSSQSPERKWTSPFNIRQMSDMRKKAAIIMKKNVANNR